MFKKIFFQNFKSFSNLTFDLINRGRPKNVIAIYGENGSGKSNIVDAFKLLRLSMDTIKISYLILIQFQRSFFIGKTLFMKCQKKLIEYQLMIIRN